MGSYNLDFYFDENLQEVPVAPNDVEHFIAEKLKYSSQAQDPISQARSLSEAGVFLRILRHLDEAEKTLSEALRLANKNSFSLASCLAHEIRLAHVYQWKKDFEKSNAMFKSIIDKCQSQKIEVITDFAWQHMGKNYFDQGLYKEAIEAFETALNLRRYRQAPADQIVSTEEALRAAIKRLKS